ncbi:MAG: tetratricopeptide repeat protein [Syntrophobacteraceae bacterium]
MYYDGTCTARMPSEAVRLVRKAAEKEIPDAQKLFGDMCLNGEGVPRDRVTACMWTILAASRGQPEANNILRYMASELTPGELKAAQEKAKNWKPNR